MEAWAKAMTWLTAKLFFKKIWLWAKEHWQIPFLVVWTVIVFILSRRNSGAIIETMNARQESYKKQIQILKSTHNEEILKRENLLRQYEETISEIENRFEKEKKSLTELQKDDIKEVVIKSKGNPEAIRKKIEEEFGFVFTE